MAAVPRADQDRPAPPVATADLEAAIAALPVRKERLRESFDRLVACAPPQYHLPFTWDDIDAHVSSLHASLSLRFRQMQQQQPHPAAPVSATAAHDDEQPHPGSPVPATASHDDEQPDPCVPVSAAHDGESIQEDEEMVTKDQSASPIPEDEEMVSKDEGASPIQDEEEIVSKEEGASPIQEDEVVSKEEAGTGAPCRQARGTRDQEFRAPMRARAGRPMLRQRYTASPPGVHSQLNLPMLRRQQPFMPYEQQEFPAMAVAMNNYNIPPMVQHPYYNIPPMAQQPYLPYCREEFSPDFRQRFSPDFRQRFSPDFRQEFFPDVTRRQPPMGIDHVLQEQYIAMARRQPYSPQQQYMAHHQPHFPVAQAAGSHGQGSNANKRRPPSRTTDRDNINVRISEPSKKSRTIREHDAKPKPNEEPFQKKTVYDYF